MARSGDRQGSGSAADVENVVAGLQLGKTDDGLSQFALSAARQQPRQEVVAGCPVQDQTVSAWCRVFVHCTLHSQRRLEMRDREEQVGRRVRYRTTRSRVFVFAPRRWSWQTVTRRMRGCAELGGNCA